MAMTKRYFAITTTFMTQIWGPTTIRISGDESVAGEIRPTEGGGVQFNFPERMVMIANHQVRSPRGCDSVDSDQIATFKCNAILEADLVSSWRCYGKVSRTELTSFDRSIPTGCISGGLATSTGLRHMATSTSS